MSLTYRLHAENDLPALQRLWEENTDWGTITAQMWRKHVIESPGGGTSIVVAEEKETTHIVGNFAFIPSLVNVNGRQYRAFRPGAPIIAKSLRFKSLNPMSHPAVAMYMHAVRALRERGDGLIYMVPDPRWVRFFKMFPNLHAGKFPLWKINVPLDAPLRLSAGYSTETLSVLPDNESIDRLWAAWSQFHSCLVVRDSRSLTWKIGGGEYEILGVKRNGELVGLVASRRKGDRQWLICDVLAVDAGESLRATVAAVVNLADERARKSDASRPIHKASILATPVLEPVLMDLGFVRDDYNFPLVVHVLDKSLNAADVKPEAWYISAND